jgi:hypothetical protein
LSFSILGRQLINSDLGLNPWLELYFRFPYEVQASNYKIQLEQKPSANFPHQLPATILELPDAKLEMRSLKSEFWFGTIESGMRFTFDADISKLEWWGTEIPFNALFIGICEGLRLSGLVSLHASIAAKNGLATAFLGPSGRGKTTTLLRASIAGWQIVAEDFSWLIPETMQLYGFDRGLRLLPDTAKLFKQHHEDIQLLEMIAGKYVVPYEQLGIKRQVVKLERLAVLERNHDAPSAWKALPKREGALALWEANGVPFTPDAQYFVSSVIPKLLAQLKLETLVLGAGELPLADNSHGKPL